ncbi:serine palmitoyltransferase 2-like [Zophobas morio]|uniref:serine palmitoyltransferase 2-like n=1 Tax=Zophobas morio TaxID=2755281 RepID=UPI003083B126
MKTADTTEKFHIAHESTHLRKPIFEGYNDYEQPSIWVSFFTYFSYAILSVYGHIYDLLVKLKVKEDVLNEIEKGNEGFVPLITDFGDFFKKNMYRRLSDCYNRPVTNVPGGRVDVLHREWDDHIWSYTVKKSFRNCLNLGSYNYLGFSQNEGPCADFAVVAIKKYGIATASPAIELGTQDITLDCEQRIARFVGKERLYKNYNEYIYIEKYIKYFEGFIWLYIYT